MRPGVIVLPEPVVDDGLLAGAICCLSHPALPGAYDEPEILPYQITLFGPISAEVIKVPISRHVPKNPANSTWKERNAIATHNLGKIRIAP